jgi:hypothetical protein
MRAHDDRSAPPVNAALQRPRFSMRLVGGGLAGVWTVAFLAIATGVVPIHGLAVGCGDLQPVVSIFVRWLLHPLIHYRVDELVRDLVWWFGIVSVARRGLVSRTLLRVISLGLLASGLGAFALSATARRCVEATGGGLFAVAALGALAGAGGARQPLYERNGAYAALAVLFAFVVQRFMWPRAALGTEPHRLVDLAILGGPAVLSLAFRATVRMTLALLVGNAVLVEALVRADVQGASATELGRLVAVSVALAVGLAGGLLERRWAPSTWMSPWPVMAIPGPGRRCAPRWPSARSS